MGPTARRVSGALGLWATALVVNRSLRRVRGPSMAPTLRPGELLLTMPVRAGTVPPRSAVVVVEADDGAHVKRVVGLPGERVAVRDGRARIDGQRLAEPWAVGSGPDATIDVPFGHVVVLGDARAASTDSRAYGPVPFEAVTRRVLLALGPPPRPLPGPRLPARSS